MRISKLLSLMLRHRPQEFGIEVDRYGFANLQAVLAALQEKDSDLSMADVEAVVYQGEKQRFEIEEDRIRARYGHSFPVELGIDPAEPPEFLYKGVAPNEVDGVFQEGLVPFDRQYVHLSFDAGVAARLGSARTGSGAVIRVNALQAHQAGVAFYDCGPTILVEKIPAAFLTLESPTSPSEPEPGLAPESSDQKEAPKKAISYGRRRRFNSRR